jgi:hypothetical protein
MARRTLPVCHSCNIDLSLMLTTVYAGTMPPTKGLTLYRHLYRVLLARAVGCEGARDFVAGVAQLVRTCT